MHFLIQNSQDLPQDDQERYVCESGVLTVNTVYVEFRLHFMSWKFIGNWSENEARNVFMNIITTTIAQS